MTKAKTPALTGEVIIPEETAVVVAEPIVPVKALNAIAKKVKAEFGKGIDAQFAIGRLLNEARALLPSDPEFGKWVAEQNFGFSQPTAIRYRQAAEREPEVRAFIATHSAQNGKASDISPTWAVQLMNKNAEQAGRLSPAVQKRVQSLFADEVEPTNGFPAFKAAAESLDLQVLTLDELVEFAGILQVLAASYKDEKARR